MKTSDIEFDEETEEYSFVVYSKHKMNISMLRKTLDY